MSTEDSFSVPEPPRDGEYDQRGIERARAVALGKAEPDRRVFCGRCSCPIATGQGRIDDFLVPVGARLGSRMPPRHSDPEDCVDALLLLTCDLVTRLDSVESEVRQIRSPNRASSTPTEQGATEPDAPNLIRVEDLSIENGEAPALLKAVVALLPEGKQEHAARHWFLRSEPAVELADDSAFRVFVFEWWERADWSLTARVSVELGRELAEILPPEIRRMKPPATFDREMDTITRAALEDSP